MAPMSQFHEPWQLMDDGIYGAEGNEVLVSYWDGTPGGEVSWPTDEQLKRIVACVNALKGIPTEALELARSAVLIEHSEAGTLVLVACGPPPKSGSGTVCPRISQSKGKTKSRTYAVFKFSARTQNKRGHNRIQELIWPSSQTPAYLGHHPLALAP